jgi:outer membrane lipoprotein-sorting protein
MIRIITAILIISIQCGCVYAQQHGADEILARLQHSYDALEDYSVTVQAEINMERVRVPRMKATLYFKQPDRIHFESESFAMLPRDGVGFNPLMYTKNYTGQIGGIDTVDGIRTTKVFLTQKNETARIRQLTIWVDTQRWVVVKMESVPSQGRQIRMSTEYMKIENTWWLPIKIIVTLDFSSTQADEQQSRENESHAPMGRSQLPRKGTVTLIYSDYAVNQHLSDELFEKKGSEKKK